MTFSNKSFKKSIISRDSISLRREEGGDVAGNGKGRPRRFFLDRLSFARRANKISLFAKKKIDGLTKFAYLLLYSTIQYVEYAYEKEKKLYYPPWIKYVLRYLHVNYTGLKT
jgi:hypothetical protein